MPGDVYLWRGYHRDGTISDERDETGRLRGFAEVRATDLFALALVPQVEGLPEPHVVISGDARPICFRRRSVLFDIETGEQQSGATVHVIGWQQTVNGRNVQALLACFEDGSVMLTSDSEGF